MSWSYKCLSSYTLCVDCIFFLKFTLCNTWFIELKIQNITIYQDQGYMICPEFIFYYENSCSIMPRINIRKNIHIKHRFINSLQTFKAHVGYWYNNTQFKTCTHSFSNDAHLEASCSYRCENRACSLYNSGSAKICMVFLRIFCKKCPRETINNPLATGFSWKLQDY